jgi:hypothetical protein
MPLRFQRTKTEFTERKFAESAKTGWRKIPLPDCTASSKRELKIRCLTRISGTAFGKGTFLDGVRPPSLFIPKRDAGFTPYNCAKPVYRYVPELLFFLA